MAFQRSCEDAKRLWRGYCDRHRRCHDPARHERRDLELFFNRFGIGLPRPRVPGDVALSTGVTQGCLVPGCRVE
eukprot:2006484-Alexandrium_andersonii.AAC.1